MVTEPIEGGCVVAVAEGREVHAKVLVMLLVFAFEVIIQMMVILDMLIWKGHQPVTKVCAWNLINV